MLFAVLAVAFFAAPIALRAVGVDAEAFENRRLADAPKPSQGWVAFQQGTRFLIDRMPLRAQAVRLNTRIWTGVFGTDPPYAREQTLAGDQALPFAGAIEDDEVDLRGERDGGRLEGASTTSTGRAGHLFLPDELSWACDHSISNRLILDRWGALVREARRGARRAALFVAPYKASVYPEYLPDEYPFDHCALAAKERFWRLLAQDGQRLGVYELRSDLLRLKPQAGSRLFQRTDSHWSTLGALTLVRAALETLGRGVRLDPEEIVRRGRVRSEGNLAGVGGRDDVEYVDDYAIVRAPDAPRVAGRTVLVCDSFGYKWFRLFKPYFEHVRYVSWFEPEAEIAKAIRDADTVIIEATELIMKAQARRQESAPAITRALAAEHG